MRCLAAGIVILLLSAMPAYAQAPEYQVKAAILANFALFVDWPPAAFASPESPFDVCVLGRDPFGPWLQREMGERVGTHPVRVRQIDSAQAALGCQMLFVSRSEESRLEAILASLRGSAALIVGDLDNADEFCRLGGMIALAMEGRKVRFDLNAKAAERAGLNIGARLKRVARSTDCGGGG